MNTFISELRAVINKHSMENGSDTPDFILADYLNNCLRTWNFATTAREKWYGRKPLPSPPPVPTSLLKSQVPLDDAGTVEGTLKAAKQIVDSGVLDRVLGPTQFPAMRAI